MTGAWPVLIGPDAAARAWGATSVDVLGSDPFADVAAPPAQRGDGLGARIEVPWGARLSIFAAETLSTVAGLARSAPPAMRALESAADVTAESVAPATAAALDRWAGRMGQDVAPRVVAQIPSVIADAIPASLKWLGLGLAALLLLRR